MWGEGNTTLSIKAALVLLNCSIHSGAPMTRGCEIVKETEDGCEKENMNILTKVHNSAHNLAKRNKMFLFQADKQLANI